ncbi:MAG: sigma-54-dependent Fis family transcriptional regulator [Candidatus Aminicenantes bacterium]|nr:sigma-54-dependent Fis family transcriptional regulator [Candidatus Aminicenantes bacterium]
MRRNKETILLVDDEEKLLAKLAAIVENHDYAVLTTTDGNEVIPMMENFPVDAVILDLVMPSLDGMTVLQRILDKNSSVPVIMLSGHGTISKAIKAIRLGAFDFLEKPVESERILITLENALKKSRLERERSLLIQDALERYQMISISEAMKKVFTLIEKAAPSNSRVLISGESGTGKELIAKALHLRSDRAGEPFVTVNCAAIPEELIESDLLGHEKGSFTGAYRKQIGKFEQASRGTLFLDEIGEMSLRIQAKVLRAIENGEIQSIGAKDSICVDVRIIAATNRDLKEAVRSKVFRQDLYYRLGVINIYIPPLRERKEDITILANHFINQYCEERKRDPVELSPGAVEMLFRHNWPGNVRELRNLIEKAIVLANSQTISGEEVRGYIEQNRMSADKSNIAGNTLSEVRMNAEREVIRSKLMANGWNYEKTASELDISRATIFKRIKELGIKRDSHSDGNH